MEGMMDTDRYTRMSKTMIKDEQELRAFLKRRGYDLITPEEWLEDHQDGYRVVCNTETYIFSPEMLLYHSYLEVERYVDQMFGYDQHHLACSHCHTPVLCNTMGNVTRYNVYRSVKAGPQSTPIMSCEKCSTVLDIGTVEEVGDFE
jgi:hypothetical protein